MAFPRTRWAVLLFLPFGLFCFRVPTAGSEALPADPNFLMDISQEFLGAALGQSIDRTDPVNDVILKTRISGTGHTTAKVGVELVPNDEAAVVDLVTSGTTLASTVGVRGPIQVYTDSTVPFQIRQRVYLRPEGIAADCAQAHAEGDTNLTGITTNFNCLLDRTLKKIACKQFYKSKDKGQAESMRHAEAQLTEGAGSEADAKLQLADKDLKKNLQELRDQGIAFDFLRFSTSQEAVLVRARVKGSKPAAFAPPALSGKPYLALRVHEAMINESAQATFAGKTFTGEELDKQSRKLGQKGPPMAMDDKDFSMTFPKEKPLEMTFADQGFQFVLRLAEFTNGEDDYTGMDMTVKYKFVTASGMVKALRQGPIEAFPPNFKPGQKLSGRQQVMRTVLQKRFGKFFKEEMEMQDMELTGDLKNAGPLAVNGIQADRGWLMVTWNKK